jgi:phage protein D
MEELLVPNKAKNDVASYNILINGNETDPAYKLMSLSILKEVNRIPVARLIFSDGDAAKRSFEMSNKNDFIPGNKIQINLGRDSKNKKAFKGIIIKHAVKVKADGHTQFMSIAWMNV